MHNKRWQISLPISPEAEKALGSLPPILKQLVFNRGYSTELEARVYLNADTDQDTSPLLLTGMSDAIDRIRRAISRGESIAIYGDYDVDGVTATALLVQAINSLEGNVRAYIPNRFDEGYGLNMDALETLSEEGVNLVITVDCGVRSLEEAEFARSLGLDLIITDHHQPGEELPIAVAVINPKQVEDRYPYKELAGVGLAYKLAEGLFDGQPTAGMDISNLLDLVALGTVADLAPLIGENRSLVRRGLRRMRQTSRQGLFSLAAVAQLNLQKVNAGNIGFILGPRLNAAGRLDEALAAFELLTTNDVFVAGQLAQQLDVQNRERQRITRETQSRAEALVLAEDPDAFLMFAAHEEFNPGVVGLAASRLVDNHYRPAIVAEKGLEYTRGSCRSIPEFHITEALDKCKDLLIRHGGHAAAAGFTVETKKLPELVYRMKSIAREQLAEIDLRQTLVADAELPLMEMKPELINQLSYLEPTGYGNPEAIFVSRNVKVKQIRAIGKDNAHLKFAVLDEKGVTHDAIAFRFGHLESELRDTNVDLMYTYETNEFNGRTYLQLNVRDVKPSGIPD